MKLLISSLLALAAHALASPHSKAWYNSHGITVTTTTTLTITVPGLAFPTFNATLPTNGTGTTTTDDLAPITLITLPSVLSTPTESEDLVPSTLIDIPMTTSMGVEDEAAAPTPNEIPPITLIDLDTASTI
jgi:hypothetical protein